MADKIKDLFGTDDDEDDAPTPAPAPAPAPAAKPPAPAAKPKPVRFASPQRTARGATHAARVRRWLRVRCTNPKLRGKRPCSRPRARIPQAPAPRPAGDGEGSGGEGSEGDEGDEEGERGGRPAPRQRVVGPPLVLEAPLLPPPPPGVVPVMVRQSNIMSVESRPFDPDTHALEHEEYFDETGQRQARPRRALSAGTSGAASSAPQAAALTRPGPADPAA